MGWWRSHRGLATVAALAWAGCTSAPPPVEQGAAAPEPPGVVLVLRGSAFEAPSAREEAEQLAGEQVGRPTRGVTEEASAERIIQNGAARLDRSVARTARAEARNDGCVKKGRALATAVAERANTILRIRLDAKTASHPATEAERKELGESALSGVLAAVGLGEVTVYETQLDGTIERTTFPGSPTTARQRIRWSGRRLGKKDVTPPVSVRDALAQAIAKLPAPAPARWEPIARGLVSGGCPVLAVAVADTFLDDGAPRRRIRAAALGVLGQSTPRAGTPPAETATATPDVAPAPDPVPDTSSTTTESGYSCTSLCTLHMVELCNNDRMLWTQNGARWENTRCGVRRSETFLENCYRMQWLSGTYERSCVQPCERRTEGRERLMALLRQSGCIRADG